MAIPKGFVVCDGCHGKGRGIDLNAARLDIEALLPGVCRACHGWGLTPDLSGAVARKYQDRSWETNPAPWEKDLVDALPKEVA